MHKIAIPQSIVDRVVARRGTAHPFAELDPKRTALVVEVRRGRIVFAAEA